MGRMRDEWEPKTLVAVNALVPLVVKRLEEETGRKWFGSGDACFLNWSVEVRCEDCPRECCMSFSDSLLTYTFSSEYKQSFYSHSLDEKYLEPAVKTLLDFCAKKREHGACHIMAVVPSGSKFREGFG